MTKSESELADFVQAEGHLIWRRYNVMIVAHSIFIGLISSRGSIDTVVSFGGVIGGTIMVYLWWALTSLGWSIQSEWMDALDDRTNPSQIANVYESWKQNHSFANRDYIWWIAHCIIWFFLLVYSLLAGWIHSQIWPGTHNAWSVILGATLFVSPFLTWGWQRRIWTKPPLSNIFDISLVDND